MAYHHGQDVMATDDEVAPKTRRVTAARITALGLLMLLLGAGGMIFGLQQKADFSTQDRAEIRQIISERKSERDRQQQMVQRQLDEQGRALCTVLFDFRANAKTAAGRESLRRAMVRLDCDRILRLPEGVK